jgi:polyisoprenoid-binding protein YceI
VNPSGIGAIDMKSPIPLANPDGSHAATTTSWRVDPADTVARFAAATLWGRAPVTGQLGAVSGTLEWDGAVGQGHMAIATSGLSSGIKKRDHHLRSGDFFDVANHPEIRFDATEVLAEGGSVRLRGELLIRGRRHPLACKAAIKRLGKDRIALQASATFDLDELTMSRGFLRMLSAEVTADVRVVMQRVS